MESEDDRRLSLLATLTDRSEKPETEEMVLNVLSGEGQDEMAGVGDIDGEGDPSLDIRECTFCDSEVRSAMML